MDIRRKTFVAEATARLEFLVREHGFAGPEITQHGGFPLLIIVSYQCADLDVELSLCLSYAGEDYVTASVRPRGSGHDETSAKQTEISSDTAHTGYQMRRGLDRAAQAIREVLARG